MSDTYSAAPLVHQIWFSEIEEPEKLPANSQTLLNLVGADRYRLWTLDRARQFIVDHFDPDVKDAFDRLKPFAYKADLARYCILLTLGGYYLDLFLSQVNLVDTAGWDFIGFRDRNSDSTSWRVLNGYFYAPQDSAILDECVRETLDHCSREYYGKDPLAPTGPSVLGRAVAKLGPDLDILMGQSWWFRRRRTKFVLPGNRVVGRGKIGGKELGGVSNVPGGNNYNDFWHARDVYESIAGDLLPQEDR